MSLLPGSVSIPNTTVPATVAVGEGATIIIAGILNGTGVFDAATPTGWTRRTISDGRAFIFWRQNTGLARTWDFNPTITNTSGFTPYWMAIEVTFNRVITSVSDAFVNWSSNASFALTNTVGTGNRALGIVAQGASGTTVTRLRGGWLALDTSPTEVDESPGTPTASILFARVLRQGVDFSALSLGEPFLSTSVSGVGSFYVPLSFVAILGDEFVVPPPPAQFPKDRLRSSISADSGSILAAVRAVPFDASHRVSFNPTQGLSQAATYPFKEATRAQDATENDVVFYPRAVQNQQQEREYEGVTLLTLMRQNYPPALVGQYDAAPFNLPNARATTWIAHILNLWAAQYAWFDFEAVPDLRLAIPGSSGIARPSEYPTESNPDQPRVTGGISSNVINFPQTKDNRKSMLEMLDELLSPFPGVIYYATSEGKLRIVPAYGPDADEFPHRFLTNDHVLEQSLGEPSAFSIINRATVTSRGYALEDFTPVMQPAWFQYGPSTQFGQVGNWFEPPPNRLNLQATPSGDILQETLTPSAPQNRQSFLFWPLEVGSLPAGRGIGLKDALDAELITAAWRVYRNNALFETGTTGFTLLEAFVPFSGVSVAVCSVALVINGVTLFVTIRANWDAQRGGIVIGSQVSSLTAVISGQRTDLIVEFTLDDASTAYVETDGVSTTYGTLDEGEDGIPAEDGGNAVQESQAAFGVIEERIDITGYILSAPQALGVAQAYVLANLTPRATREVELGVLGSTQVLFDDRGRMVMLPNADVGRLVGVSYSDDFVGVTASKRARVEVEILGAPGSIVVSAPFLANDDLSPFTNDSGSFSEVL